MSYDPDAKRKREELESIDAYYKKHPEENKVMENKEDWADEFDELLKTFNINNRPPQADEVELESAVKSFISALLKSQEERIRGEITKIKILDWGNHGSKLSIDYRKGYSNAAKDILNLPSLSHYQLKDKE